jgi:hypothetical protein
MKHKGKYYQRVDHQTVHAVCDNCDLGPHCDAKVNVKCDRRDTYDNYGYYREVDMFRKGKAYDRLVGEASYQCTNCDMQPCAFKFDDKCRAIDDARGDKGYFKEII